MKEIVNKMEYKREGLPQILAKDMAKFHRHFAESSYNISPFIESHAIDPETM
jgi:hypothetical protein